VLSQVSEQQPVAEVGGRGRLLEVREEGVGRGPLKREEEEAARRVPGSPAASPGAMHSILSVYLQAATGQRPAHKASVSSCRGR